MVFGERVSGVSVVGESVFCVVVSFVTGFGVTEVLDVTVFGVIEVLDVTVIGVTEVLDVTVFGVTLYWSVAGRIPSSISFSTCKYK